MVWSTGPAVGFREHCQAEALSLLIWLTGREG